MDTRRRARSLASQLTAVLAVALAACGGGASDKAGGKPPQEPVVLTLASTRAYLPAQLDRLPEDIARRSGGTLRIDFQRYRHGTEPGAEKSLIEDVQAGRVDMAWAGVRAFDLVGVTSLQPLVAPFLVDSFDLEGKVFEAGIPQRMLQAVDTVGLTGIGVVPGPMSKIMGVAHPFATRGDFVGAIVGTSGGQLAEETIRALGATPKRVSADTALDGLDGLDDQLDPIRGNGYYHLANAVTANVNLWPGPLVVFVNAGRFARLTPAQQDVLRSVVADHVAPALAASRQEDAGAGSGLCRTAMTVVTATPDDLAGLRTAVEPVYAQVEQDPANKAAVDEITAIKTGLAAPAESFDCGAVPAPPGPAAAPPLDGVYEMTVTFDEVAASGGLAIPENYGSYVVVFDRGRFALTQESDAACTWAYGTYVVSGDRFEMTYADGGGVAPYNAYNRPGERFAFGWSLYRDGLTLTEIPGQESPLEFRLKRLTRTGATPSVQALNQHCPPPVAALWPADATVPTTSTT
jgi:TRAP-type C4-dicarboxylate transport system substrate-binding protein